MERLIESVRKYPCLWKVDSEEYKLNDLKEAAWREVTKECELPDVKETRTIWKKLRDGHRQAIAKNKTVTGQAASIKNPWKYEKQMEFLLPTMKNRKRSTNIDPVPRSSQDNSRDGDEIETQQNAESPNNAVEPPYGEFVPPNKKTTLVSVLEKEYKRREERSVARTELRNQILQGASTGTTQNSAMDTFFKSMQLTTNALPERLQLKVQRQIFNIVMEAKEEHLTTLSSTANSAIHQFRGGSPFLLPINNYAMTLSPRSTSSSSNYSQTYISPPPQSSPQDNQARYRTPSPRYTSSSSNYPQTYISPPPQSSPQDNQARYSIEQTYTSPPPQSNAQDNQATYNVEQPYTSPPLQSNPPATYNFQLRSPLPQSSPRDNQARYSIEQTYTPPPPPQSNPQTTYNVPPPPQSSAVVEEVQSNPPATYNFQLRSPLPQSSPRDNQARYSIEQTYTPPPPPQSNPQTTYNVPPPPQSSAVVEEVSHDIRNYMQDFDC